MMKDNQKQESMPMYNLVEEIQNMQDDADSWKTIMFLYNAALKEIETKISILNDEFQHIHQYNPIEHVKYRLKTSESIVKKLKRYGHESSILNMVQYIHDIAGIRITCGFTSDVYRIVELLKCQKEIHVLQEKDYISLPKISGYQSYHLMVEIPIYLSNRIVMTKVEIQIRTIAQDFWASLEHKIYYKFEGHAPSYISESLRECAKIVRMLDERMLKLNQDIQSYGQKSEEKKL